MRRYGFRVEEGRVGDEHARDQVEHTEAAQERGVCVVIVGSQLAAARLMRLEVVTGQCSAVCVCCTFAQLRGLATPPPGPDDLQEADDDQKEDDERRGEGHSLLLWVRVGGKVSCRRHEGRVISVTPRGRGMAAIPTSRAGFEPMVSRSEGADAKLGVR